MSSKRHIRRKSCTGKRRYVTQQLAIAAKRGRELDPYRCQFCGGFHLGHRSAHQGGDAKGVYAQFGGPRRGK
jgi:hypothetical protein